MFVSNAQLVTSIAYRADALPTGLNETIIMLVVLALIDVVIPEQPEWLSHVNASVLKVKLTTAIIGISSIHLLKTFINAANYSDAPRSREGHAHPQ